MPISTQLSRPYESEFPEALLECPLPQDGSAPRDGITPTKWRHIPEAGSYGVVRTSSADPTGTPMPTRLAREIAELRSRLLDMATIVAEQFTDSVEALLAHDVDRAKRVLDRDREVDALELEVDEYCQRILARHQPVATDLRTLLTVEKINTDLERIGDHCCNLARNAEHVTETPGVLEVDRLHHENFRGLVDYIQKNPEHAEVAAHLITASKAIERISDHSTNIAKGVVFLIEGVDIRHASVQEEMAPESSSPLRSSYSS